VAPRQLCRSLAPVERVARDDGCVARHLAGCLWCNTGGAMRW
jgi:hypothetical protein